MKAVSRLFMIVALLIGGFVLAGCEEEGDIEQGLGEAGEEVERSTEQAADEIDDRL
jgi:outer membrane murein-binding lipoprotein Lpp